MIIPILNKRGNTPKPYQITKERVEHKEGKFIVWKYHKKVIVNNQVMYKYSPIRYDQELARFKTRKDAKEFGRYIVGL
jgi:hypothetical protein